MKMRDILSAETKQQLEKEKSPSTKEADPSTRQEWEEIMGTKRDTFKRVGGRVRRK
ncbi:MULTISPECIES: hypothetical protein [Bacillus]|uniref:hypothetical protein n=1 Tax=Bacillus TaxID=1386 RepID=UPI0014822D23|nr:MULTISPECIES: hypothetical protein [Bacillus amyloliquefaciens group]MCZ4246648.1 hypothetical protein [Bacillus amyloliquefaciens]MED0777800.1 hypothetical protein [Bacillus siamensis]MED0778002.1 hypothetical protein [Bacillus siamensis]MED0832768.1 hypothetical protein [Bacillus siamensis]MED3508021.1 hypothetical protein [Bacillus velezensis]